MSGCTNGRPLWVQEGSLGNPRTVRYRQRQIFRSRLATFLDGLVSLSLVGKELVVLQGVTTFWDLHRKKGIQVNQGVTVSLAIRVNIQINVFVVESFKGRIVRLVTRSTRGSITGTVLKEDGRRHFAVHFWLLSLKLLTYAESTFDLIYGTHSNVGHRNHSR